MTRRPWPRMALLGLRAVCLTLPLAAAELVDIELITLHAPNGHEAYVNLHEITTLRAPTKFDLEHYFPPGTHCIVVTTTSKFLATQESCPAIRDMIERRNNNSR